MANGTHHHHTRGWTPVIAPRRRPRWLQLALQPCGMLTLFAVDWLLGPLIAAQMWAFGKLAEFAHGCLRSH